jgi:hypothetical protein
VHFFELRLDRLPALQLDNGETIAARLVLPVELRGMRLVVQRDTEEGHNARSDCVASTCA